MSAPTPVQIALLKHFAGGIPDRMPYGDKNRYRAARQWACRRGLLENTGRTAGIANTVGGVQWLYTLTPAGRRVLDAHNKDDC